MALWETPPDHAGSSNHNSVRASCGVEPLVEVWDDVGEHDFRRRRHTRPDKWAGAG